MPDNCNCGDHQQSADAVQSFHLTLGKLADDEAIMLETTAMARRQHSIPIGWVIGDWIVINDECFGIPKR